LRPAGTELAVGRGFPSVFRFLGVGCALGEAADGPEAESDAAFSDGGGVSGGDPLGAGD
jgi:hypothetical protein